MEGNIIHIFSKKVIVQPIAYKFFEIIQGLLVWEVGCGYFAQLSEEFSVQLFVLVKVWIPDVFHHHLFVTEMIAGMGKESQHNLSCLVIGKFIWQRVYNPKYPLMLSIQFRIVDTVGYVPLKFGWHGRLTPVWGSG